MVKLKQELSRSLAYGSLYVWAGMILAAPMVLLTGRPSPEHVAMMIYGLPIALPFIGMRWLCVCRFRWLRWSTLGLMLLINLFFASVPIIGMVMQLVWYGGIRSSFDIWWEFLIMNLPFIYAYLAVWATWRTLRRDIQTTPKPTAREPEDIVVAPGWDSVKADRGTEGSGDDRR